MKRFEVSFRPLAEADLFALYRYIAAEAGHAVAGAYIGRIFHGGLRARVARVKPLALVLDSFPFALSALRRGAYRRANG